MLIEKGDALYKHYGYKGAKDTHVVTHNGGCIYTNRSHLNKQEVAQLRDALTCFLESGTFKGSINVWQGPGFYEVNAPDFNGNSKTALLVRNSEKSNRPFWDGYYNYSEDQLVGLVKLVSAEDLLERFTTGKTLYEKYGVTPFSHEEPMLGGQRVGKTLENI